MTDIYGIITIFQSLFEEIWCSFSIDQLFIVVLIGKFFPQFFNEGKAMFAFFRIDFI